MVYLLSIIRQIPGGPHTLCLRQSDATKAKGAEGVQRLYDNVGPIARLQPYIHEVKIIQPGDYVDWASEGFRMASYVHGQTLMQAHLNHLIKTKGIGQNFNSNDPWLKVEPSLKSKGRIVCNRTGRYRGEYFQWAKLVAHYRHRLLFVGLHHEWREFIGHFGYVEFAPTKNMLEVAQLIAGAELFVGNQSCANAIAEGLKQSLIQEVSPKFPDCIFKRPNAQHVVDGSMTLPDIDGSGEIVIPQQAFKLEEFELNLVPRHKKGWGWFYQHEDIEICESTCEIAAKRLRKLNGKTLQECKELVIRYNVAMSPKFFGQYLNTAHFHQCKVALAEAGCTDNSVFRLSDGTAIGIV